MLPDAFVYLCSFLTDLHFCIATNTTMDSAFYLPLILLLFFSLSVSNLVFHSCLYGLMTSVREQKEWVPREGAWSQDNLSADPALTEGLQLQSSKTR